LFGVYGGGAAIHDGQPPPEHLRPLLFSIGEEERKQERREHNRGEKRRERKVL